MRIGKGFFLQELGRIFVCVRLALRPKKDENFMPKRRKKMKNFEEKKNLAEEIERAVEGLYYTSETDSEIFPFIGDKTGIVSAENLLEQLKHPAGAPVEERDFDEIFERLTENQDWFGEEEIEIAKKFANLRNLLKENLKDLKVFKIGKINLDVYFVGLDSEGILMGIKTEAVET